MSLRKSPAMTEEFLAAARGNGSKSSGPKTTAGKRRSSANSYRHGLYAAPDNQTRKLMLRVGEDPDLLARLEREFIEAMQPANAMEAMIVADIAKLYRDKALLEKSVRAMRLEQAEVRAEWTPIDEEELEAVGYLGLASSIEAFQQGRRWLDRLLERVRKREWTTDDDLNRTLELLCGKQPPDHLEGWCLDMRTQFEALASLKPEVGQAEIDKKISHLKSEIREMRASVDDWEQEYREDKTQEVSQDLESRLVPGNRQWNTVLKQQARLDRMIASKVKLLNLVRKECRKKGRPRKQGISLKTNGKEATTGKYV